MLVLCSLSFGNYRHHRHHYVVHHYVRHHYTRHHHSHPLIKVRVGG
jgi:hypothetical protein